MTSMRPFFLAASSNAHGLSWLLRNWSLSPWSIWKYRSQRRVTDIDCRYVNIQRHWAMPATGRDLCTAEMPGLVCMCAAFGNPYGALLQGGTWSMRMGPVFGPSYCLASSVASYSFHCSLS